jgi:hypothetical protein
MTNNDLIDKSISDVLKNAPLRHKPIIDTLNVSDLIELYETLINFTDLAIYDMVNEEEMIAIPYIGRIKIKEGTKNATIIYKELLDKHGVESINDLSTDARVTIKEEFNVLYKDCLKTQSDISKKEEMQSTINFNIGKIIAKTLDKNK